MRTSASTGRRRGPERSRSRPEYWREPSARHLGAHRRTVGLRNLVGIHFDKVIELIDLDRLERLVRIGRTGGIMLDVLAQPAQSSGKPSPEHHRFGEFQDTARIE